MGDLNALLATSDDAKTIRDLNEELSLKIFQHDVTLQR